MDEILDFQDLEDFEIESSQSVIVFQEYMDSFTDDEFKKR